MENQPVTTGSAAQQLMIRRVVWAALSASVFIYGFVAFHHVSQNVGGEVIGSFGEIKDWIYILAGLALIAAYYLPNVLIPAFVKISGTPSQNNIVFLKFILRMALLECPVLLGLVLTFMSYNIQHFFFLSAPAFFGMLMTFPKKTI